MARKEPIDFDTNHPIHDSVFGNDRYGLQPRDMRNTARSSHTMPATSAQPEGFQPMRDVGDTDQVDRQPDGSLRR
jgi:hypothetical protein